MPDVASPIRPSVFCPQHQVDPPLAAVVTAQVWFAPALMLATAVPVNPVLVLTAVGVVRFAPDVPSPVSPSASLPQQ